MGILKKLFGKPKKQNVSTNHINAVNIDDLTKLMTAQLVALCKRTSERAYFQEYMRRLTYIGFTQDEARRMFEYESVILKAGSLEILCRENYVIASYFNLTTVLLPEQKEFYITNKMFLCSEITKIWDEAEWHFANSHERNLPDSVWAEIYRISRYGGAELFIEYITAMAADTKIAISKLQAYSRAEQGLLYKYRWYPNSNKVHPYGVGVVEEVSQYRKKDTIMRSEIDKGIENATKAEEVIKLPYPRYCLADILALADKEKKTGIGEKAIYHDVSLKKWKLTIQLDDTRHWFLSLFLYENGNFEKYSLDYEGACDSHYEFVDEEKIREKLYLSGDEKRYLDEIFIRYVKEQGGYKLADFIAPYITAQFHYD